jgi:hypothetical protein
MELLRDRSREFDEAGVRVFAISRDSPWTHIAWSQVLDLTFPLLSDWNGEAIDGFGIAQEYRGFHGVAERYHAGHLDTTFKQAFEEAGGSRWEDERDAYEFHHDQVIQAWCRATKTRSSTPSPSMSTPALSTYGRRSCRSTHIRGGQ